MAYGDFKYLTRRTASDRILGDKAFNIAENPKYDGYQRGIAPVFYKFFDKKTSRGAATFAKNSGVKNENMSNKEIPEELHKPVIRKFKKKKVYLSVIDNIWVLILLICN